jgi:hypothetical protein
MDFIHSPIGDIDARDSDLGELPDAPDGSIGNAAMLFCLSPFVAIGLGFLLAVVTR